MRHKSILLMSACLLAGCANLSDSTSERLSETGKVLAEKAFDITKGMVVNYALEKSGIKEGDFLWGLTEGMRSVQTAGVSDTDIKRVWNIWVPTAPKSEVNKLAAEFKNNTAPPTEKVEAIIRGVTKVAQTLPISR